MGFQINRSEFTEEDRQRFSDRLHEDLDQLRKCLDAGQFCDNQRSLGAELELVIVDDQSQPLPLGSMLKDELESPQWALEIDRFNLEYNLRPVDAAGAPFSAMGAELDNALAEAEARAQRHGGSLRMIGILPTLREAHLGSAAMNDLPRFRAMSETIRQARHGCLAISIDGVEPLHTLAEDVTWEGANTSFQMHMRVAADEFAKVYNAVQLVTAPALALSTNSPYFCGHSLWEETRIALFKQAVDSRIVDPKQLHTPARVNFGTGWVRSGVLELFAQAVSLYEPLLPLVDGERVAEAVGRGPSLAELRLHAGSVWTWNRPVYDPSAGGHLRIEARALPAGPTTADMMASAAFLVGASYGLAQDCERLTEQMPFSYAEWNFYHAAREGMDAQLVWPGRYSMRRLSARQLAQELLPVAERGLAELSVAKSERNALLAIVAERLDREMTGARWQRKMLAQLERSMIRDEALPALVARYAELSRGGQPVHTWPL